MVPEPPPGEPLAAGPHPPGSLAALATRAITLAEDTNRVQGRIVDAQAKSRRTIKVLFVSVTFEVLFSIALCVLALVQFHTSQGIHASQLAACAIGNEFRVKETTVWDRVVQLSTGPPNETQAQRVKRLRELKQFQLFLSKQFHAVDCAALYGK
jgi:hypothetical protein